MKAFLHSHSYTGNPLGCAVAVETLNIFDEEKVLENNAIKSDFLKETVSKELIDIPQVGEYRQIGMIGAIELVKDKASKEPFDSNKRVGYHIYKKALDKGVILRPLGNIIYFMPPYVIKHEEIEFMVHTAKECICDYFAGR